MPNASSVSPSAGETHAYVLAVPDSMHQLQDYHEGHASSSDEEDDNDDEGLLLDNAALYSPMTEDQDPHSTVTGGYAIISSVPHEEAIADSPAQSIWPDQPSPAVPIAMSQLSEQLAQLQGTQGNNNLEIGTLGHIGSVHTNMDVDQNLYTLSMHDFLWGWGQRASRGHVCNKKKAKGPGLASLERQRANRPEEIWRCDLEGDRYDIQGMNWFDMGVTRQDAREARQASYKNFESIRHNSLSGGGCKKNKSMPALPNSENFLRFRRMDLEHKPHLCHFQLRNLMACTSQGNVLYAGDHKVYSLNLLTAKSTSIMDLTDPDVQAASLYSFAGGVKVSTLAAKHDILLAGGFCGEYGMINLNSSLSSGHIEGLIPVTPPNSITNHISISLSRSSGLPQAALASNENGVRILDCTTNTFTAAHTYPFPINCTAISPDNRLRVIVGDMTAAHICNTDTGQIIQTLPGHTDYGFACAWADNGWHVATGNQDMTVKIWDARMWTDSRGNANPLKTMYSELGSVRSLQFSPLGSGKRILVACEAADVLDVIDAESYESKQVLDFFGEIGGACFTPDGQDVYVANCDNMRGGIIEYERTGEGARMGYQMDQCDIDEINRTLSRRKTRPWLNDQGESEKTKDQIFKSKMSSNAERSPDAMDSEKDTAKSSTSDARSILPEPKYTLRENQQQHWNRGVHVAGAAEPSKGPSAKPSPARVAKRLKFNDPPVFLGDAEDAVLQGKRDRMGWSAWNSDVEDILDMDEDAYVSIEQRMRQQARGYDWRQTDAQVLAGSRSNGRTLTWQRRKHLFGSGSYEPLVATDGRGGGGCFDIGL